ncbi:type VI secretion system Vgr family protein [Pseudomonas huanghezhanensis]|uniref:type VI secretion system Vgr family protein n=1 Tax=Pseudomonas huanghezhanensis TaxID=3002903 RepID=UPI002285A95C|nr:contractile injection system protein, VgrG/Pvc8 family [Pseudomonas sp. BSw22131]
MSITEHHCHFRLDSIAFPRSLDVMTFKGQEALSRPFLFEVQAVSLHQELNVQQCLFSDVYLSSKVPGVGFHAQIQNIGRSNTGPGPAHYQITLGPRMGSLAHRSNQRIFQNMPAASIIRKVLREHGIHEVDYAFDLNRQYEELAFCAQHGETDLQLLERLCRQEGIVYYFEHSTANHLLVFSDEMRHTRRTAAAHFESQAARGEITRFEVIPSSPENAGEQRPALRIRGASALPFVRAGMQLPMTGHPDLQCNQAWLLTDVRHWGLQPVFKMGAFAPAYLNAFSGQQASCGLKPAKPLSEPRKIGLHRARVVGASFDEVPRDHEGRIKVRFEWGDQGDGSRYNDCWIPVDSKLDQPDRLWEGGMEVVVSFVEGDPDRPEIMAVVCDADTSTMAHTQAFVTAQNGVTTRLDRQDVLGDTGHIHLDGFTLQLGSSNELSLSVGGSHVRISGDDVTLTSPTIVLTAHGPVNDQAPDSPTLGGQNDGKTS